jgi:endoglucanase
MSILRFRRVFPALVVAAAGAALLASGAAGAGQTTRFYVPPPSDGALQQVLQLARSHDLQGAALITKMELQPRAVWLNGGTSQDATKQVRQTMVLAAVERAVPTFVIYDLPFRDCGQYSSGGALNTASYLAYVKAVAKAIGNGQAIVILEPDGLGLVPNEGCTPSQQDLAAAGLTIQQAEQARYDQLNGAVDLLKAQPNTKAYLDATHPGWLNVGDASQRLVRAGVQRANGFFLNVSNYQYSADSELYGTWISDCIAYATGIAPGDYGNCPNQYWDGGPATSWTGSNYHGGALDPYEVWSDQPYSGNPDDLSWNTVGIDSRWAQVLNGAQPTTHFVIDTSRNGVGPWDWAAAGYPDAGTAQDWCNPPGRGLGPRPQANPDLANPLLDAYLWVKTPGQSDGSCTRGTAGSGDPQWGGATDPAAGAWFAAQALQLARLAQPPLR